MPTKKYFVRIVFQIINFLKRFILIWIGTKNIYMQNGILIKNCTENGIKNIKWNKRKRIKNENEILYIIYISYVIINISILLNSTNIRLNFGYIV